MITNVSKVIVPVRDQQAALEFWTTTMGFSLVRDDTYGDERWIEVKPPGQDLRLVLSVMPADEPRRTVPGLASPLEPVLQLSRHRAGSRRTHQPRRGVSAAACQTALRLVGAVRRQRGHPVRARTVG